MAIDQGADFLRARKPEQPAQNTAGKPKRPPVPPQHARAYGQLTDSHTMYNQAKAATTRGLPRKKAAKGKTSAPLPLPTTKVYRHSAAEKKMTPAGTKPGKKQKKKKAAAGAAKSSAAVMSPRTRSRNFGQL